MLCKTIEEAKEQAQANANTFGARFIAFTDTSGNARAEVFHGQKCGGDIFTPRPHGNMLDVLWLLEALDNNPAARAEIEHEREAAGFGAGMIAGAIDYIGELIGQPRGK